MTQAETAVRRFYEPLSTGNATLADKVLTPDAKTSRCPLGAGPPAVPARLYRVCRPPGAYRGDVTAMASISTSWPG